MSEFKGTKGKLKLHESITLNQSGFYMQSISSEFNNKMLFANTYGDNKKECIANAKLIACAPEMLKMLIGIRDNLPGQFSDLNELIKKATE